MSICVYLACFVGKKVSFCFEYNVLMSVVFTASNFCALVYWSCGKDKDLNKLYLVFPVLNNHLQIRLNVTRETFLKSNHICTICYWTSVLSTYHLSLHNDSSRQTLDVLLLPISYCLPEKQTFAPTYQHYSAASEDDFILSSNQ